MPQGTRGAGPSSMTSVESQITDTKFCKDAASGTRSAAAPTAPALRLLLQQLLRHAPTAQHSKAQRTLRVSTRVAQATARCVCMTAPAAVYVPRRSALAHPCHAVHSHARAICRPPMISKTAALLALVVPVVHTVLRVLLLQEHAPGQHPAGGFQAQACTRGSKSGASSNEVLQQQGSFPNAVCIRRSKRRHGSSNAPPQPNLPACIAAGMRAHIHSRTRTHTHSCVRTWCIAGTA